MDYQKIKNWTKGYLADTTGIVVFANPTFAIWENVALGFSDTLSIDVRIDATITSYLGVGLLYSKGRDLYLKGVDKFNNKLKKDTQKNLKLHDALYSTIFSCSYAGALYSMNNASLDEIIVGSITAAGLGTFVGIPNGYFIDLFRNIAGLESKRDFPKIRNMSKMVKIGVTAGIIAASTLTVGATYKSTPEGYEGLSGVVKNVYAEYVKPKIE